MYEKSRAHREGKTSCEADKADQYRFLLDNAHNITARSTHRFQYANLTRSFGDGCVHRQHYYKRTYYRSQPDQHPQKNAEVGNTFLNTCKHFLSRLNIVAWIFSVDPLRHFDQSIGIVKLDENERAFTFR